MPELPEVEIARRQLAAWTAGRRIIHVEISDPTVVRTHLSTRPSDADPSGAEALRRSLTGMTPDSPQRVGKRIGWPIGLAGVLIHLGMTGKWVRRGEEPEHHGRLALTLDDGHTIWFVDTRRFGCVVHHQREQLDAALHQTMGPDALDDPRDGPGLSASLRGRRAIKVALLDQTKLAGVGNIQAAETLWCAHISPTRGCESLSGEEWDRLAAVIPAQLQRTIDALDAEEITYISDKRASERGTRTAFAVYGNEGAPCPRCSAPIERVTQSGRVTFYCPACQG